jgi:hypothetical protein
MWIIQHDVLFYLKLSGSKHDYAIPFTFYLKIVGMGKVTGDLDAVQKRFLESREQCQNVFINILSDLQKHDVINQIAGARQGPKYAKYNRFSGGKVIIKLKARESLIYLNVDGLKWKKNKKPGAGRPV